MNQRGFLAGIVIIIVIAVSLFSIVTMRFALSEQVVSGVVYNTKNNKFISGNTSFSIRASENTYVSEENRSSYCLPPNSQYKDLVNRAAENKDIKVVVTTKKFFKTWVAPWTCVSNVTVEEKK